MEAAEFIDAAFALALRALPGRSAFEAEPGELELAERVHLGNLDDQLLARAHELFRAIYECTPNHVALDAMDDERADPQITAMAMLQLHPADDTPVDAGD